MWVLSCGILAVSLPVALQAQMGYKQTRGLQLIVELGFSQHIKVSVFSATMAVAFSLAMQLPCSTMKGLLWLAKKLFPKHISPRPL